MHGSMRRREETRPVGYAARFRRLPPTLPLPAGEPRRLWLTFGAIYVRILFAGSRVMAK
jgi:hypothetical protein